MSNVASVELSNLMAARRLLEFEKNAELRRSGKDVEEKSALDYFEEDQAYISDSALTAQKQNVNPFPPIENITIKLSDLHKAKNNGNAEAAQETIVDEEFIVTGSQSVEVKLEMRYRSSVPLEGLLVHDQNYAESDRYLFKFADGATFTILDKWTNKSTTIWGDPHVDVDDVSGNNNGDFKDLKTSDDFTTFMLSDGTRVTFKAKDDGIIEQVDIFKGSQHVKGVGAAARGFSPETGLFSKKVLDDGLLVSSRHAQGDVIYAGGDGNDWFDAGNKLIWGKTTGAVLTQRPSALLEFYYKQTISQSITVQAVARNA
ncbi:MAG: DUF1521 domain-containing protein [Chloroflexi bacterium]|nr:DUF1521 domain-containing protein [Chloroflexota bacterium]